MGVRGLQAPAGPGRARRGFAGGARKALLVFLLASLAAAAPALADEATESRLRDALRQAVAQARALEDSQGQLQARLSDQDKTIAALKAQAEQKTPPSPAGQPDRAVIERIEAEANRRIAAGNAALSQAGEATAKWKAAYEQAANVARAKEAERVQLAASVDGLDKRAQACEAKNQALFQAGNQILDHLKDISLAEALAAHEPFVGLKRVELQTLAQDDEDKLLDHKVGAGAVSEK